MAKVSTNISLDAEDKVKAQKFLAAVGMDLSTAVGVFIKQMLREGRIPFEIRGEIPNKETLSAMEECEEMKKNPQKYKRYKNADEMMEDILSEV